MASKDQLRLILGKLDNAWTELNQIRHVCQVMEGFDGQNIDIPTQTIMEKIKALEKKISEQMLPEAK